MVNGKISRNYFASDFILNIQYPALQYFRLNFYFVKKNIIILQLQSDKFLHLYCFVCIKKVEAFERKT